MALRRQAQRLGEAAVRQRYGLPERLDLNDVWRIVGEQGIGANSPSKGGKTFGPSFQVNQLPSSLGWPPFMFRLSACTPDALNAADVALHEAGREKVGGVLCTKYLSADGNSALWVEPRTKIALRQETLLVSPGTRRPSVKVGYVTRKFRLIKSASTTEARLPPGSTVELPESLFDLPLPSGVRRKRMTGLEAKVGFPLQPYPSGGAGVIR